MTRNPTEPTGVTGPIWTLGFAPWQAHSLTGPAGARVIIDNDFAGDPDDLVQLVHHLLSPVVEIPLIISSHLRPGDRWDPTGRSAENGAGIVRDVFTRMGLTSSEVIVQGTELQLTDLATPQPSPAVDAIIREAMRDDVSTPLFYAAGGGLTDLASALLTEPRVAERMTLIWIGGAEHADLASPPPGAMPIEYNLLIDVVAGQVVFNESAIPIWQVPRDVYRQCLMSETELRVRVASTGPIGGYLFDKLRFVFDGVAGHGRGRAGAYALGDSPLVLLTALTTLFEPDSASSRHIVCPTPELRTDGGYEPRPDARPMRIYTQVDNRLMFEDFILKLEEFEGWRAAGE
ncbi:hypothetical protein GCM10017608_07060 [Agromyces luteolus]|uniref:Nucleoside hydrolase n=1 Tax=Agromyces luteolus TaxID=88373 RepID=A0A7C9I1A1_9MICO|nr:nucleoside hydrolase [Agromyces luteolus]MUN08240.1 nucleoside hydrolase [Agromyces luteolus]GLK26773.1 hypothetical protein GCM10017608_07060 [Agromyces luteolus]